MRDTIAFMAMLLGAVPAAAETVTIEASRDATLIEHPEGLLANGAGPALFVGRTAQVENGIRRALIHFDVVPALPDHALRDAEQSPTAPRPPPSRAGGLGRGALREFRGRRRSPRAR
jgi:hypothetical protein